MSGSRKLLLVGGLLLVLWGMSYGLYFALFDEHQALESITASLAAAFAHAAGGELAQAHAALDRYSAARFEYLREVDVHSHWSGLALLLVLFGLLFEQLAYTERTRWALAAVLLAGSFIFPLGVILQTVQRGAGPEALAGTAAALLTMALAAVAAGFARQKG